MTGISSRSRVVGVGQEARMVPSNIRRQGASIAANIATDAAVRCGRTMSPAENADIAAAVSTIFSPPNALSSGATCSIKPVSVGNSSRMSRRRNIVVRRWPSVAIDAAAVGCQAACGRTRIRLISGAHHSRGTAGRPGAVRRGSISTVQTKGCVRMGAAAFSCRPDDQATGRWVAYIFFTYSSLSHAQPGPRTNMQTSPAEKLMLPLSSEKLTLPSSRNISSTCR